jgi:hypothetical protein
MNLKNLEHTCGAQLVGGYYENDSRKKISLLASDQAKAALGTSDADFIHNRHCHFGELQ